MWRIVQKYFEKKKLSETCCQGKSQRQKKFGHFFSDFPNMGNGNNLQILLAVQCLFTASIYFSKKIVQIVNMTVFTIPVIV